MSCLLIGEARPPQGELIDAATALKIAGLRPHRPGAQRGLACSAAQASTAFALEGLFRTEDLFAGAITIGAMSVGRPSVVAGRSMPASMRCAASAARSTPPPAIVTCWWMAADRHVPPQLREGAGSLLPALPAQVMGACLAQIRHAAEVLVCEANAVSDNPLVFAEDERSLRRQLPRRTVAFAADNLAWPSPKSVPCRAGMALLIDSRMSGLPASWSTMVG